MAKKQKLFDHDRQEPHPPRVPEPFVIVKGTDTPYALKKNGRTLKKLTAFSEDGAHREAMNFLYNSKFIDIQRK